MYDSGQVSLEHLLLLQNPYALADVMNETFVEPTNPKSIDPGIDTRTEFCNISEIYQAEM